MPTDADEWSGPAWVRDGSGDLWVKDRASGRYCCQVPQEHPMVYRYATIVQLFGIDEESDDE